MLDKSSSEDCLGGQLDIQYVVCFNCAVCRFCVRVNYQDVC